MKLIYGEIEPGLRIGNFIIGSNKEDVVSRISGKYKVWERGDGFCAFTMDNFKLWFGVNGELEQIGVTKGFLGSYKSIGIGQTMKEVTMQLGKYENDGDVYSIAGINGICFELEDVDDWDELTAPIEWIFVYKC